MRSALTRPTAQPRSHGRPSLRCRQESPFLAPRKWVANSIALAAASIKAPPTTTCKFTSRSRGVGLKSETAVRGRGGRELHGDLAVKSDAGGTVSGDGAPSPGVQSLSPLSYP